MSMCFITACLVIPGKASTISVVPFGPSRRRSSIFRRVGSESAFQMMSSSSFKRFPFSEIFERGFGGLSGFGRIWADLKNTYDTFVCFGRFVVFRVFRVFRGRFEQNSHESHQAH